MSVHKIHAFPSLSFAKRHFALMATKLLNRGKREILFDLGLVWEDTLDWKAVMEESVNCVDTGNPPALYSELGPLVDGLTGVDAMKLVQYLAFQRNGFVRLNTNLQSLSIGFNQQLFFAENIRVVRSAYEHLQRQLEDFQNA